MGTDRTQRELINLLHVPMPIIPQGLGPELTMYLQELTRTLEENLRRVFGAAESGKPFAGTVLGVNNAPFYDCLVQEILDGNQTDLVISDSAPVLDLIDLQHSEKTLTSGDKILCWRSGTHSFIGVQYFGRSTIGLA